MAELYLDDDARRAGAISALIAASKAKATTPKKASVASVRAKEVADAATLPKPESTPVVDEQTKFQQKYEIPAPRKTAAQLKEEREKNYYAQQELLKGEKPQPPAEDENYTYDYEWHVFPDGGGEWRLVRFQKFTTKSSKSVDSGQTTNVDVLKSLLRGMGFTTSLIDSSADFLNRLLKDGLDYDNAISIFLDSKEYTFKNGSKTTSPFYTAYGYLNEGLTTPKSASELFNAVEGYKEVVAKYALSDKYLTSDSLKKYVKNNVSVSELDERANAARLKAVNADKNYTDALVGLGYIKSPTDLTDFFLNPDIGKEALEQNRSTAAFSAEAIRRAQQGVTFDAERFKKITASLMGLGLSEEKIAATAAEGFEQIGEQLRPTQKLAGIYERMPASDVNQIQQELESEQFLGTASQRRKRLAEQEVRAFQRSAGTTTSSLKTRTAGVI